MTRVAPHRHIASPTLPPRPGVLRQYKGREPLQTQLLVFDPAGSGGAVRRALQHRHDWRPHLSLGLVGLPTVREGGGGLVQLASLLFSLSLLPLPPMLNRTPTTLGGQDLHNS